MPSNFPPSSPILGAASANDDPYFQPLSDDVYGPGRAQYLGKRRIEQLYNADGQYPTPVASSTTGRSSSPIRAVNNTPKNYHNHSSKSFPIKLNPRDCTRLAIGRKKSVCDIVLPSKKNISRQHAFITYLPSEEQVKLECNGINGIVVVVPLELQCQLKRTDSGKAYRLLVDEPELQDALDDKELENSNGITSFVLLKGESVLMPFIKGTTIDFRQAEGVLSMKDIQDDEPNSTDTEDEQFTLMPPTDEFCETITTPKKLIMIPQSPPTAQAHEDHFIEEPIPQLSQHIALTTPDSSLTLAAPTTPVKLKEHGKMKEEVKIDSAPILGKNVPELPSQNFATSELAKEHGQKLKQHKPDVKLIKTPAEILLSLEKRGIPCEDLQHVLANHLAFANVQQTPLHQLQQVSSKTSTLSRVELRALLRAEPCIGVIHREGKDAAGKPLDEEYYYDMENDPETERRSLVTALKGGRSGLRSCRRTHKQYFWKRPAK